jgi:hypothetical protein
MLHEVSLSANAGTCSYVEPKSIESNSQSLVFSSYVSMLDYVTRNWRTSFATTSLTESSVLREFLVRPFAMVLKLDAPLLLRWSRLKCAYIYCLVHRIADLISWGIGPSSQNKRRRLRILSSHTTISSLLDARTLLSTQTATCLSPMTSNRWTNFTPILIPWIS